MIKNILTVNPFQKLNKLELEFLKWFKLKKKMINLLVCVIHFLIIFYSWFLYNDFNGNIYNELLNIVRSQILIYLNYS